MIAKTRIVDHPKRTEAYEAELLVRLSQELLKGPRNFLQILQTSEGAYPTDVRAALQSLLESGNVQCDSNGTWSAEEGAMEVGSAGPCRTTETESSVSPFPEPHPLDFDWRFSPETLQALFHKLTEVGNGPVAVLGAPTLFKHLVDSGISTWLFDRNHHVLANLRESGYETVTECDLFDFPEQPSRFTTVFADPPWYVEHYRVFMEAASKLLLPGGHLFLSMLARLTRPSASTDRFRVFEGAFKLGFDLKEVVPSALGYQSPAFETEALRADGIGEDDWRSGDLFVFTLRVIAAKTANWRKARTTERWESVLFGKTTIKVKVQPPGSDQFDFSPASPTGELRLRSVSRRSPTRPRVNLWTSRNLALTVSNPTVALAAIRKVATEGSISTAVAVIAYEYQLSAPEVQKLENLLQLLMSDAP